MLMNENNESRSKEFRVPGDAGELTRVKISYVQNGILATIEYKEPSDDHYQLHYHSFYFAPENPRARQEFFKSFNETDATVLAYEKCFPVNRKSEYFDLCRADMFEILSPISERCHQNEPLADTEIKRIMAVDRVALRVPQKRRPEMVTYAIDILATERERTRKDSVPYRNFSTFISWLELLQKKYNQQTGSV